MNKKVSRYPLTKWATKASIGLILLFISITSLLKGCVLDWDTNTVFLVLIISCIIIVTVFMSTILSSIDKGNKK